MAKAHTSQPVHIPTRHRAQASWHLRWWHGGLAVLVLLGVGIIAARPRVTLASSSKALTAVRTLGLGTHITQATVLTRAGISEPLVIRQSGLWPSRLLKAQERVQVRVVTTGLLGWDHTQTFSLVTPKAPQLRHTTLTVDLNQRPTAHFTSPVAQVRLGTTQVVNAGYARTVAIGPIERTPGQHGTVSIAARSRVWEPFSGATAITWSSVPWLTASATQDTTGHSNLSTAPIDVTFSSAISRADTHSWSLSPAVSGSWQKVNHTTWQFNPSGQGWAPDSTVTLTIPGGTKGPVAQNGSALAKSTTLTVQLPQGTTLRLQEWLAELGYLPLNWTPPSTGATPSGWGSVYTPPSGTFSWRYSNVPTALQNLWIPTYWTAMTQAAVIAFQHQAHLTVNGIADPQVWTALRQAVKNHTTLFTKPYAYVYVSETLPERLWLWVGGKVAITTLANTGIPQDPTTLGSYAVDLRYPFQIMRGKNPNGTPYADPVHWINYFDKSQAVHGFLRAQYGFPQSLGCVEVPIPIAKKIYPHLYIGALVTVEGPGSSPLIPSNATT